MVYIQPAWKGWNHTAPVVPGEMRLEGRWLCGRCAE